MSALDRLIDSFLNERALALQVGVDPGVYRLTLVADAHCVALEVVHDGETIAAGSARSVEDAAVTGLRALLAGPDLAGRRGGTQDDQLETALVLSLDAARARKVAGRVVRR